VAKYKDIDLNFTPNPVTKDACSVKDERAIVQSIKSIVLYELRDFPYEPLLGSTVNDALFEIPDETTSLDIRDTITTALNTYETRIILDGVDVVALSDERAYQVNITYSLTTDSQIREVGIFLDQKG